MIFKTVVYKKPKIPFEYKFCSFRTKHAPSSFGMATLHCRASTRGDTCATSCAARSAIGGARGVSLPASLDPAWHPGFRETAPQESRRAWSLGPRAGRGRHNQNIQNIRNMGAAHLYRIGHRSWVPLATGHSVNFVIRCVSVFCVVAGCAGSRLAQSTHWRLGEAVHFSSVYCKPVMRLRTTSCSLLV